MTIQPRALTNENYNPAAPTAFKFPQRLPNGATSAPILVLCEPPTLNAIRQDLPMEKHHHVWFAQRASHQGFVEQDMMFVGLCPPVPLASQSTAKKRWEFVNQYAERVRNLIAKVNPSVVITCGDLATRVMMQKPVKITRVRGQTQITPDGRLIFPVMSPRLCTKQPDYLPIFDADLGTLMRLKQGNFDPMCLKVEDVRYEWCTDLQFMLDNRPKALAVDTETTGLNTLADDFAVITVQLTPRPGLSYVVPVDEVYWPEMPTRQRVRLKAQLKELLEDPSIMKMGHHLKYDHHALQRGLGITVTNWKHDTETLARCVNENFLQYNIDDMVRIYVPEMSGFNDDYNARINKNDMRSVSREDFLMYAGGDTDACFRLARALQPMLARDPGQHFLYQRVMMRGMMTFALAIEQNGQCIDREALEAYEAEVTEWVETERHELFMKVPAPVRRKWLTGPDAVCATNDRSVEDILFGKDGFLIDVLFRHPQGFNLKPQVFTASTRDDPDPAKRVPSVSTKDHLPYFESAVAPEGSAGNFVHRLIQLKKANKLLSTYIKGFYKYIKPSVDSDEEKIYPSYNFRTNTFRTNSQDPNGQNFPKRGQFAKGFLRLIKASANKMLVAADLSQIELRLTAWTANEQNMLHIYRSGGDIHEATAAAVSRVDIATFQSWKNDERPLIDCANEIPGSGTVLSALSPGKRREFTVKDYYKLQRFRAKAVNFGFIYGAQWRTFQTYAKTQYGVDYTDREAQETREIFFETYKLETWHRDVEQFVKRHGYVPTLHGGKRHLPSVWSDDRIVSSGAVRQAINAPIQRFGSDLGVIAFNRLAAQADPRIIRPVGFVHDQVITEVDHDEELVRKAMGWLVWVMENPPLEEWFGITPPLPIVSEPDYGLNLADTTEVSRSTIDIVKPEWWNDNEEEAWQQFVYQTR